MNIGNIYDKKLKDELREIIAPKASKQYKKRAEINKMVEELFELLKTHKYLVENHPPKAGGGQAVRSSYSIGEKYEKALEDYMNAKQDQSNLEVIEKESDKKHLSKEPLSSGRKRYIIREKSLKDALAREHGDLWFHLYTVHKYILDSDFKTALKLEHNLIKNFLIQVYGHYYRPNYVITDKNLYSFIDLLGEALSEFFSKGELQEYLEKYKIITFDQGNLEDLSQEIHQYYTSFCNRIKKFIDKE